MGSGSNTGCDVEPKDDDSLIDRCWEEQYRGDSRKWLIRDGSYKRPRCPLVSTMKATYPLPDVEEKNKAVGKRRVLLIEKLMDEAAAEVARESNEPPTIEDYCTEYDGNYHLPGFRPDQGFHKKDTELYEKFPLYSSIPVTYYGHNPCGLIPGATKTVDPRHPFRRHSGFTKPLSEVLDEADL